MAGPLNWITTVGATAGDLFTKWGEKEAAEKTAEAKIKEIEYLAARERRAAAEAAAEASVSALNSKTLQTVVMWTLTTIAGALLAKVVFNAAGIKGA